MNRIEWPNFWFMTLTPIVALAGTAWTVASHGFYWQTWVLFGILMMATGLGITTGYHRLFSHLAYRAHPLAKIILLLLGGASFEGSAREWCNAHRRHHKFVDGERDPYNIRKGFWHAHVGWVVIKDANQADESFIPDLLQDKTVLWQDRYYIALAIAVSFVLPLLIALSWGDPWGGLFIAGFLRMVVNHHLTFLINSYAHYFGGQNFSDRDSSRDSWLMAFFTYGEGYHNFHHTFQFDYRNGYRKYHFDPGKWLIGFMQKAGLAWNLKMAHPARVLAARLQMDEKRYFDKMLRRHAITEEIRDAITHSRERILEVYARYQLLKTEYTRLKKENIELVIGKIHHVKADIRRVKSEFRDAMENWQLILQGRALALS